MTRLCVIMWSSWLDSCVYRLHQLAPIPTLPAPMPPDTHSMGQLGSGWNGNHLRGVKRGASTLLRLAMTGAHGHPYDPMSQNLRPASTTHAGEVMEDELEALAAELDTSGWRILVTAPDRYTATQAARRMAELLCRKHPEVEVCGAQGSEHIGLDNGASITFQVR